MQNKKIKKLLLNIGIIYFVVAIFLIIVFFLLNILKIDLNILILEKLYYFFTDPFKKTFQVIYTDQGFLNPNDIIAIIVYLMLLDIYSNFIKTLFSKEDSKFFDLIHILFKSIKNAFITRFVLSLFGTTANNTFIKILFGYTNVFVLINENTLHNIQYNNYKIEIFCIANFVIYIILDILREISFKLYKKAKYENTKPAIQSSISNNTNTAENISFIKKDQQNTSFSTQTQYNNQQNSQNNTINRLIPQDQITKKQISNQNTVNTQNNIPAQPALTTIQGKNVNSLGHIPDELYLQERLKMYEQKLEKAKIPKTKQKKSSTPTVPVRKKE